MESTGRVVRDGDHFAIRFEREYGAAVAHVWAAITAPEKAAAWLGELRGTLAVGEKVVLVMGDDEQTDRADLVIRECTPPRRLVLGWTFPGGDPTTLTVELTERRPGRTHLSMVHTGWRRDEVPGYGCGWHHFVDALAAHLAGAPQPPFEAYYPARLDEWRKQLDTIE